MQTRRLRKDGELTRVIQRRGNPSNPAPGISVQTCFRRGARVPQHWLPSGNSGSGWSGGFAADAEAGQAVSPATGEGQAAFGGQLGRDVTLLVDVTIAGCPLETIRRLERLTGQWRIDQAGRAGEDGYTVRPRAARRPRRSPVRVNLRDVLGRPCTAFRPTLPRRSSKPSNLYRAGSRASSGLTPFVKLTASLCSSTEAQAPFQRSPDGAKRRRVTACPCPSRPERASFAFLGCCAKPMRSSIARTSPRVPDDLRSVIGEVARAGIKCPSLLALTKFDDADARAVARTVRRIVLWTASGGGLGSGRCQSGATESRVLAPDGADPCACPRWRLPVCVANWF